MMKGTRCYALLCFLRTVLPLQKHQSKLHTNLRGNYGGCYLEHKDIQACKCCAAVCFVHQQQSLGQRL